MEHPLIGDLNNLTLDEWSTRVADLNSKLSMAMRTGNGHLCNQIRMAIESFQTKYQDKIHRDDKNNFDEIINIS